VRCVKRAELESFLAVGGLSHPTKGKKGNAIPSKHLWQGGNRSSPVFGKGYENKRVSSEILRGLHNTKPLKPSSWECLIHAKVEGKDAPG